MKKLLKNIRTIRETRGLSQYDMAKLMNVSQSQYARAERGSTRIDLHFIYCFCEKMDMTLIDLIGYPDKYIKEAETNNKNDSPDTIKASITIELDKNKKDQVLRLVFGDKNFETLTKQLM